MGPWLVLRTHSDVIIKGDYDVNVRGNQAQSTSFFLDSFVSLCESLTQKQQTFIEYSLTSLIDVVPKLIK